MDCIAEKVPSDAVFIRFTKRTTVTDEGGVLTFGDVRINTRQDDEDDDE